MPLLFSYINKETDPDNLWKIQRRVAKSLREANDDDRGLVETADMSEDTDDIIKQLDKILNNIRGLSADFLNESRKKQNKVIDIPNFDIALINSFLDNFKKIDVNKMNASNIEKIEKKKNEIIEILDGLKANLQSLEENITNQPIATRRKRRTKAQMAAAQETKEETGAEETKEEPPAIGKERKIQYKLFIDYFNYVLVELTDFINRLELRLSNYRQTARVLTQEGVEPVKTGGCMYCDAAPIEYRPEYQNQMYY
jgi:hypothetical protein|tara:strand:+ start:5195 stop:5959 length:765 start_codon:yes stop_codon:yes gene_type:complete